MAHALQIDTLAFSKKLREAGAEERLAEAIVEGITAADTSELATKADLKAELTGVKADIAGVKTVLKGDIKTLEIRMEAMATKEDMAKVRTELKGEVAEVRTEIAQSTNRAIYTLGGLVTVLFVLDRIIPLFGIAN